MLSPFGNYTKHILKGKRNAGVSPTGLNIELSVRDDRYRMADKGFKDVRGHANRTFQTDTGDVVLRDLVTQSGGKHAAGTIADNAEASNGSVNNAVPSRSNNKRSKIPKTILLLSIYATTGLLYGQMGPTLPDLQRISDSPLEKASFIFTGFAVGYLIGCLLGGLLLEKANVYLLLFIYTFGNAVTTITLPWIPEFIVMVINRFITGILVGGQDTAVHTVILQLWAEQGGRFIHITHILASFGALLSPLITEPFVLPLLATSITVNSTSNQTYLDVNGTFDKNATLGSTYYPESNIYYAFLITGILAGVAAFPPLYVFVTEKEAKTSQSSVSADSPSDDKLPSRIKGTVLVILCANSFLATATVDTFPGFLTTFVIEQLDWTQSTGTLLTSLYFATYALGNVITACAYNYFKTTALIGVSYITTTITLAALMIGVVFNQEILIWLSITMVGLTTSVLLPTFFAWTQSNVTPVTGRISSAFLFTGSAGVMTNPLFLGYFMDNDTAMWFLYCLLGETVLCVALFVAAYALVKAFSSRMVEGSTQRDNSVNTNEVQNTVSVTSTQYIAHL